MNTDATINVTVTAGGTINTTVEQGGQIASEITGGGQGPPGPAGEDGTGGGGAVETVVAGNNIDVDATDPANPVVAVETLTTADVADSTDKRYVTDADLTDIGNLSGTNTGDQTLPVKATGAETDTGTNDAKFLTPKAIEDSSYAKTSYADALVVDSIADSDTTHAPSRNSVFDALAVKQPLDSDLTAVAGLTPVNDDVIQRKSGAWTNRTPAQLKTDLSLTKGDVGLGNVDNTSDANKPVSSATQAALDAHEADTTNVHGISNTANLETTSGAQAKADAKVTQNITNGVTNTAPSEDAVFDAMALKQPLDSDLTAIAGLTSAADKGIQFTGAGTAATYDLTTAGKALLDDANAAAQIATLGLDADLATFALPASTTISTFGASLIDDAAASNARTTLGLGTIATQDANNVSISGGSVAGITDLAIADGGTGQSTASAAFGALKQDATTSATGVSELATTAETDTGTDTGRVVTPDGLSGSVYGTKVVSIQVIDGATTLTTGDGKAYFRIPTALNGMDLIICSASVLAKSTSGTPTVQLARGRQSNATTAHAFTDMLTTKITIDANEFDSKDAATAAVIDTSNDDVATGDLIRIDVDVAGTGTTGLFVTMQFRTP